jgi:phospholipid/cholesterol/gamma-HCH transport system permease protein
VPPPAKKTVIGSTIAEQYHVKRPRPQLELDSSRANVHGKTAIAGSGSAFDQRWRVFLNRFLSELNGRVGSAAIDQTRRIAASAALMWAVVSAAVRPAYWHRTVREAWIRQVIFSGVNAVAIICFLALALGVLVCVQFEVLVGQFNQSQILPAVFVVTVVRELGPLLVNFVLIARSGNAIATEMALKQVTGEIGVIEGQGIEPFTYLVLPRVLGLTFCAMCLTVFFIAASLVGLYVCGEWIGTKTGSLYQFTTSVLALLTPADVINLLLKSTIPSLIAGCICCLEGFNVGSTVSDVPKSASRAIQRSIVVLFAASAFISLLTYLR